MVTAQPHRGRRKDTQGSLWPGSGAGRSEAGQRHAKNQENELLRDNRVRLDLSSVTSRCATCTWAPCGPRAPSSAGGLEQHGASRGSSIRWRTSKSTPLPGHQPHVPGLHKPRGPCGARTPRGGSAPSILHFTCLPLALTLTARLQPALKLGAGGPRKGLLEDDHVVDDGLLHPIRSQLQVGVARKAHAHPLGPVVLEVAGLPCTPARPDGSLWTFPPWLV